MTKDVLFIQGAGEGAYEDDKKLFESLSHSLGSEYDVHYPPMPDEVNASYEEWKREIEGQVAAFTSPVLAVGHSIGAATLIKCLSEIRVETQVSGIFLIAAPFWGGNGWLYEGYEELELPADVAQRLPEGAPIFLYHCRDDEIVPFGHLSLYAQVLRQAAVRVLEEGGHQLNNDLAAVARDIGSVAGG